MGQQAWAARSWNTSGSPPPTVRCPPRLRQGAPAAPAAPPPAGPTPSSPLPPPPARRALAGPTLYTNIDVGLGSNALASGGPSRSGPNALAGTTWWGIRSAHAVDPPKSNKPVGDCAFGPVINLVDVNLKRSEVGGWGLACW